MPASEAGGRTMRLVAESDNPFVEVIVVNGAFQLETSGFGKVEAELAPGVYRVDFRAGLALREEYVLLDPDSPDDTVRVRAPAIEFSSPVPLLRPGAAGDEATRRAGLAAAEWSRAPHARIGSGSRLFVFARSEGAGHPLLELTLHDAGGTRLLRLADSARADLEGGCAGACVELDPGAYRLRVPCRDGEVEQLVWASPGWTTHLFLRGREGEGGGDGPDLSGSSMQMTPLGAGFDPADPGAEWTEMLRILLVGGRHSGVPGAALEQVRAGAGNPMLGILAGHLLLRARNREAALPLAAEMAESVGKLVGAHPDVLALRLGLDQDPSGWSEEELKALRTPPMLCVSYPLLARASAVHDAVAPPLSLTARIADRICGAGSWLVWRVSADPAGLSQPDEKAGTIRVAVRELAAKHAGKLAGAAGGWVRQKAAGLDSADKLAGAAGGWVRQKAAGLESADKPADALAQLAWRLRTLIPPPEEVDAFARKRELAPLETALLTHISRALATLELPEPGEGEGLTEDGRPRARLPRPALRELLGERQVVRALGAPMGALAQAALGLAAKLGAELLAAAGTREAAPASFFAPSDTQKGKFGGAAERDGRRVDGEVREVAGSPDWFDVRVVVRATSGPPLSGSVRFFLHETFPVREQEVPVRGGEAVWEGRAWGAFTVGAVCDGGGTSLELDLGTLSGAPQLFRDR